MRLGPLVWAWKRRIPNELFVKFMGCLQAAFARRLGACLAQRIVLALLVFTNAASALENATAVATVKNGQVTAVRILKGGSGYTIPPFIQFRADDGFGAIATSVLRNGAVVGINVSSGGAGYVKPPTVYIGAPAGSPDPEPAFVYDYLISSAPNTWVEIQWSTSVGDHAEWRNWTNVFTGPLGSAQLSVPGLGHGRYYRMASGMLPDVLPGFVWIGAGTFKMGSPVTEVGRKPDETEHEVVLTHGFWMSDHLVTQAEYVDIMGENPSRSVGTNLPVDSVSWQDARIYCKRLNLKADQAGHRRLGHTYRLPTEAEWEWAARSGSQEAFFWSDDSGYRLAVRYAWCRLNSNLKPHPVNSKSANKFGLYDMAGNVFQWCNDTYGPYENHPVVDPTGLSEPTAGPNVTRGGSWNSPPEQCRSASRAFSTPGPETGFRVVFSPLPAMQQSVDANPSPR